jgi:hypothetical protein
VQTTVGKTAPDPKRRFRKEQNRNDWYCQAMPIRSSLVCVALMLSSCHKIPFDTEESLIRIHRDGRFKVGVISSNAQGDGRGDLLIANVARTTGARPVAEKGAAEVLLQKLEEGELDLVIGVMAKKSPWQDKVHFLPSISRTYGAMPSTRVMARNGENAWISLVHVEAEKVRRLP